MSSDATSQNLLILLMGASSAVAERINVAVVNAGYADLRPVHGLVFARIAGGGASINRIAEHLGITKQSASSIVEHLEHGAYVTRRADPADRRAWIVELAARGRAVTEIAGAALAEEVRGLENALGKRGAAKVVDGLGLLAGDAVPRAVW